MAQVIACDGCIGTIQSDAAPFTTYGVAEVKQYCPDCAPLVDRYLKERDEIHENAARQFNEDLEALWAAWKHDRPNGTLPDFRRPA
jgi:hypothetical protein